MSRDETTHLIFRFQHGIRIACVRCSVQPFVLFRETQFKRHPIVLGDGWPGKTHLDFESHLPGQILDLVETQFDTAFSSLLILHILPMPQQRTNIHPYSIGPQQPLDNFEVIDDVPSGIQEETRHHSSPLTRLIFRNRTPTSIVSAASVNLLKVSSYKAEVRLRRQELSWDDVGNEVGPKQVLVRG